jgi:type II secretory pathway pseudopilin PulG
MQRGNSMPGSVVKERRDSGAMLLAVLFMMAIMVITALAVAPAFIMQAKRDREEEMIHRGTEYARAIKKYYKKFGRYPTTLEQLDNTNQIRFLRRRYKDPLTKDGQWKLLHYGDIQALVGGTSFLGPGFGGGNPGGVLGANPLAAQSSGTIGAGANQAASTATIGVQGSQQQPGESAGSSSPAGAQPGGGASPFSGTSGGSAAAQTGSSLGTDTGQGGGVAGTQGQGVAGQSGSNNTIFGNTGVGGQTFGGGAIVGVASKSKDPTIRIYNKKKTYDEWVFIYSPMMDLQNVLLRGPYNGMTFVGMPSGIPGQVNQGSPQGGAPGVQLPTNQPQNQNQVPPGNAIPPGQIPPQ